MASEYSLDRLQSELAAERHRPVYLLHGPESFLRDEAVRALKDYVFARSPRDFNYDRYDAREGQLEQALATARTLPMLGPLRLVIVHGMDTHLGTEKDGKKGGGKKKRSELAQELLERYLESPEERAVLVLLADKADARRRAIKLAEKAGAVLEAKALRPRELPRWIGQRATRLGLRLEGATSTLLADVLGNELGAIERSLEKLRLYVGERSTVRPEDVEACVAHTKVHSVFELTDAVGERHTERAMALLHRMLGSREAPLKILSMLYFQIRRLWLVRSLLADGVPASELSDRLGIMHFLIDDLCRQARLFARADLLHALDLVFETDRALKTSQGDPERVMEVLVLGLCTAGVRRR